MKCQKCNGSGKQYWNGNVFVNSGEDCPACGGIGLINMTNEEWFCGLSTEEKAIWIERIMFIVRYREEVENGAYMQTITKKDYIEKWLKQPHKEEKHNATYV